MNRILFIGIVLVISCSCQKTKKIKDTHSIYTITAKLDTTDLSLDCQMQVDWHNSSDSLLSEIPFTAKLDTTKTLVHKITVYEEVQNFKYVSKETNGFEGFILKLSTPVRPNAKISISINFKTKPNEFFREHILFYADDFPLVQYFKKGKFNPYYQVHSDYDVAITYPKNFKIAATGQMKSIETIQNESTVKTSAKSVPSYGFVLLKDVILKEDSSSGVKIRSFYFENDSKWGEKLLEYSKNIIDFYEETFGFYPQPTLSIIPGYPEPYGGWPVCPNVVGIHRGIDQKKEKAETHAHWIMSHEIGHQYWGFNYVLEPLDYPRWFGVGMGIHTDKLYAMKHIPEFDYSKYFSKSYLPAMEKGYNTTIMQTVDSLNKQGFDWNNAILHDKSFFVLQMLAFEIGEETFFEILKYCLEHYKGINVTLEMFKKDCETISGKNLDDFFQSWFFTNDYLEYQIETVLTTLNNNQYQHEIRINKIGKAAISRVELEIVLDENKKRRIQFDGKKQTEILKITTEKSIHKIILDPDLKLLLVNRKEWIRDS